MRKVTLSLYIGVSGISRARSQSCSCPKDRGAGSVEDRLGIALVVEASCGRSPRKYLSSKARLAPERSFIFCMIVSSPLVAKSHSKIKKLHVELYQSMQLHHFVEQANCRSVTSTSITTPAYQK